MTWLRALDDDALERLLRLAVDDADPADVMPPGWTPDREDEFRAFYRGLRPDVYEIVIRDVGTVGMARLTPDGDFGMWIARSHRGQGYAGETLRELRTYADALWVTTMTARTTPDNTPMIAALRRAGAVPATVDGEVHARIGRGEEPALTLADPATLLRGFLDFHRDTVLRKLDGLSDEALRTPLVPSGWTPLSMVKHLAHVELRWLRLYFAGEDVENPRGNPDVPRAEWVLEEHDTFESVREFYVEQVVRSRRISDAAALDDVVEHWPRAEPAPTLAWILFHLLQEYARHVGHLDIVRELIDGETGA
ncbi:hypothetical protein GCM10022243_02210 [Saccharothrix violaceirubra]|uniref:RimJ/RimL family protein N-acetyltransferase/uncharacterized damage-inducible protein DinB n=1 Tax=Saccharothrix violaceirubra TaxID=413306 RepID=A0A7W7T447_9PSEU|nr:GNAT family N-acetyltransferase [Saccharothrix violaceirubra]MBB4965981.1 RimJ/RimL family protein N-acetyltransferase/uncharacterized damage-inducible protein DinB [Saccharothrix violaceirubra]